ncbi:MAG: RNA methyltransferase [Methanomassiliicoccales archaeon]
MPAFRIVLVRPENEGNIGAVARVMANFGFTDLALVSPVAVGEEARKRAKHANFILDSAIICTSIEEAVVKCDYVIGSTGIRNKGERKFLRSFETPREFASRVQSTGRRFAILFGPEGLGLLNNELSKCDSVIIVPTDETYPVMNLSHAVAVILYELFISHYTKEEPRTAVGLEKEKLSEYFSTLLELINYPEHKRQKTALMFRRLIGRSGLTKWEFFMLMGVLSRTLDAVRE